MLSNAECLNAYLNDGCLDVPVLQKAIDHLLSKFPCIYADIEYLQDQITAYKEICGESSPAEIIELALQEHNASPQILPYETNPVF